MGKQFTNVHLEAEQVTEAHRTLEADHTITTTELPGVVNVYLVIDGGRILLDQLKSPVVLEAIERGKQNAQTQTQAAETPAQTPPEPQTQNPQTLDQPQG